MRKILLIITMLHMLENKLIKVSKFGKTEFIKSNKKY